MKFCADYRDNLLGAFASVHTSNASDAWAQNPPVPVTSTPVSRPSTPGADDPSTTKVATVPHSASAELCKLLFALRKLREGLRWKQPDSEGSASAALPYETQVEMHMFSLRLGLLCSHPPTYVPSLHYLLSVLHRPRRRVREPASTVTVRVDDGQAQEPVCNGSVAQPTASKTSEDTLRPEESGDSGKTDTTGSDPPITTTTMTINPPPFRAIQSLPNTLPPHILSECTTYLILDAVARQSNPSLAYTHRHAARKADKYENAHVDAILHATVHDDWLLFWRSRSNLNAYQRGILRWAEAGVRRKALKAIGKSYLSVDADWVEACAGIVDEVSKARKAGADLYTVPLIPGIGGGDGAGGHDFEDDHNASTEELPHTPTHNHSFFHRLSVHGRKLGRVTPTREKDTDFDGETLSQTRTWPFSVVPPSAMGGEVDTWDWDRIVREEGIGWAREGDRVTIRTIRAKGAAATK